MSKSIYEHFGFHSSSWLILRTIETYSRTDSGASWRNKPDEVERNVVSDEHYSNYVSAIPFFNRWGDGASCRASWGYTGAGYLPTEIFTISPYRTTRKVARFRFVDRRDLERAAGFREREILGQSFLDFETSTVNGSDGRPHRLLKLIAEIDKETRFAVYDETARRWVD